MDLNIYIAFVVAAIIMIALPGPSVILTVAHSISFGWQPAISTVGGATLGIAVQLIIATTGLGSLLTVAADVFEWLRWAGAAYLIYLGVRQWRSSSKPVTFDVPAASKSNLFHQGLVVTVPNPKSLIFISAILPQFIDSTSPLGIQFAIIVPTFLMITFTVTSMWAFFAGNFRAFLHNQRAYQSVLRATGGLMIVAGIGLAMARRNT